VIVMDIRHPLADYDRQMLSWGQRAELPVLLLLTKADKLGRGAARSAQLTVERQVQDQSGPDSPVHVITFSAPGKTGVDPVQVLLDQWLAVPPAS